MTMMPYDWLPSSQVTGYADFWHPTGSLPGARLVIAIHRMTDDLPAVAPRPACPPLLLADTVVAVTQMELRRLSDGQCEAFAVWVGRSLGDSAVISHVITLECPAGRDWPTVPSAARAQLTAALRREKLLAFADLHTHPEAAFLSHADRARPFSSRPGFYAVVIPYFAAGAPWPRMARLPVSPRRLDGGVLS